jgi:hypothetical protein
VTIGRVSRRAIPVSVTLDRPGLVRLRAVVTRSRMRRRHNTRIAERTVRFQHPGTRRLTLGIGAAGRAALSRPGRLQLTVTARYQAPSGQVTVRRVRRLLRR